MLCTSSLHSSVNVLSLRIYRCSFMFAVMDIQERYQSAGCPSDACVFSMKIIMNRTVGLI